MKITKPKKENDNVTSIVYPLWPLEGNAKATIEEWENGEGFDIELNGTKIELTYHELHALIELSLRVNRLKMIK